MSELRSEGPLPVSSSRQESLATARKVHLISLGCSRNRVDSEVMLGTMFGRGWQSTDVPEDADAIVVNTCGFIAAAKEESIDTILQATTLKERRPGLKVVVAGCLTQRYKTQLMKGLPEVDLFIGTDEFTRIGALLDELDARQASAPDANDANDTAATAKKPAPRLFARRTHYLYNEAMPRVNTLARHSAYIKIAEGCQHNCAFCIIPAIRGRLRSRAVDSVVKEARELAAQGVLEINLIAQDLAAYGRDRNDGATLLGLLKELAAIDGLAWIRCLYMYPEHITDEFLDFFASAPKLVKYLDVPIQHASDRILAAMKRDVNSTQLRTTLKRLRERVPDIAIRTSVMVGFPGETAADFEELKNFVRQERFRHLGCFAYSQEEGTVAGRMPEQIPEDIKQERLAEIMAIQQEVSRSFLSSYPGKTLPVLVEGPSAEHELVWQGRLATQAPEVDGVVYLTDGPVQAGTLQMVKINEAHDYDLVGEVLGPVH